MTDAEARPAWDCVDAVDIRRFADRDGLRFSCALLIDAGDNQHRLDNVVVRVGPCGERDVWVTVLDPGSGEPYVALMPRELAGVIALIVLPRVERVVLGTTVGASDA